MITLDSHLELLMLVVGGLLGSAHCLGMCGGFALALVQPRVGWAANLGRQLVYSSGRISVYAFAGAAAGFLGRRFALESRSLLNAQAVLCWVAGGWLILEGSRSMNWLPRFVPAGKGCPMMSFGSLLRSSRWGAIFAAGVWNGFLPCGLVYAYLALAASKAALAPGMAVMICFGAGTVPALALAGMTGSIITAAWRGRFFRFAAVCLLVMGVWTIVRGIEFFSLSAPSGASCPLCDSGR